ncbi:response regulator [Bacillus shivajii]|uniref:response regulator n=1 Tax=Bacillus shivajii TaxID=1983719 RepID=UPI001CFAB735|nr:response regulator [Bacillus shivajii]UCZ52867.1 response regulator [Bacillus shivajii]
MAKVLVTDDAAFMRMHLKNILKKIGHEVVGEAEDGQEAIEKYRELQPDLVTMDITMPIMNGIEAIKIIKNEDPNATVIICSAMGQQQMVVESIQAGAKDFIIKPFSDERVEEAIQKVL